jgi:hypothetical protein
MTDATLILQQASAGDAQAVAARAVQIRPVTNFYARARQNLTVRYISGTVFARSERKIFSAAVKM